MKASEPRPSIMVSQEQRRQGEQLADRCLMKNSFVILAARIQGIGDWIFREGGDATGEQWDELAEELAQYFAAALRISGERVRSSRPKE